MFVIFTKYVVLVLNGYKSSRKLFYINLVLYALYLCGIIFIDYMQLIIGKSWLSCLLNFPAFVLDLNINFKFAC
jgi:hypothetical protein